MRTEAVVNLLTGNVETRIFTAEENAVFETEKSKFLEQIAILQAEEAAIVAAKESAKAKLAALGLTEEEVSALLG